MGSRLGRYATLVAALFGCTRSAAPPGFPAGDTWVLPLVGPLEEGLLLVPALVNGKGPFVFAIDTDAHVSVVDSDLVQEVGPRTGQGPELLDETNIERDRFYAEIREWQLGTLTIKNKPAQIVPAHAFDDGGRRIHGVIGRDILPDSLTFSFDRHRGEIVLTTKAVFAPNPSWQRVDFTLLPSEATNAQVIPPSRKLVEATINGERFTLHLDLGASASQLRAGAWARAKLTESPVVGSVVDEVGTPRKVTTQGTAAIVALGAATTQDVGFIPYSDRRWPERALAGTLGLDFFKSHAVHVDWDASRIYLRSPIELGDVTARIGRWQSKTLSSCERVGCVKVTLIDPLANRPVEQHPATHPGVVASIGREKETLQLDLEVLVAVTAADGTNTLDWLLVNMPAGVERTLAHLPPAYLGATTTVLDASPFPRDCPKAAAPEGHGEDAAVQSPQGGCVDKLKPPLPFVPTEPGPT